MSERLQTALVTGANRGIGLALVTALASRGMRVIAGARDPGKSGDLQALAATMPDRVESLRLDVTDPDESGSLTESLAGTTIDLLINNAGVLVEDYGTRFEDIEPRWFDRTFAVNVTGAARVTRAVLPLMAGSPNPRVVNISSGAGSIADRSARGYYCYGASKAALNHLTVSLAEELAPRGVTVVALSPGWVRTDMGGEGAELSAEESAAAIAETVLRLTAADTGRFLGRDGSRGGYRW